MAVCSINNGANAMQTNHDYRINEPLRNMGNGWQADDALSRTSRLTMMLAVIAGCASTPPAIPAVQVPDKLSPGADESLAMIVSAKGVQIYECRASKGVRGDFEWAFVAPE